MKKLLEAVTGGVLLGIVVVFAVFLAGMRSGSPTVVTGVRRFNRAVSNPRMMRTAGRPGVTTSIIRHVGRNSAREYETPVGAVETDDGFVIGLPYRLDADWTQNVLAAGSATLVKDGREHRLARPEVVSTSDVIEFFGTNDRRAFKAFNVQNCLRLRHAAPAEI